MEKIKREIKQAKIKNGKNYFATYYQGIYYYE